MTTPEGPQRTQGHAPTMATVSIRLIVLREDPRADALLADVAARLGLPGVAPDEHAHVYLRLEQPSEGDAWQRVRGALDAAGEDWWAYFHLPPHATAGDAAAAPDA
jgi:hypothetical protein